MSTKQITVYTKEGNTLILIAVRQVRREKRMVKPFLFQETGIIIKKVSVQYGIGTSGHGDTLKAAISDFQKNWAEFRIEA